MGQNRTKGKLSRRIAQQKRNEIRHKMGKHVYFTLTHCSSVLRGFSNKYCYKSNMHSLIYKGAYFRNIKFQTCIITSCNFRNAHLTGIDFSHTNLKNTSFKNAKLDNVIFFACNLRNVDFRDAQFNNVSFVCTDISGVKELSLSNGCIIVNRYPSTNLDSLSEQRLLELSAYPLIYSYRVLHVNKDKVNMWNLKLLFDEFGCTDEIIQILCDSSISQQHLYTVYAYKKLVAKYLPK